MRHPLPWSVKYHKPCKESSLRHGRPYIVDANGDDVLNTQTHTRQPGVYDEEADRIAHMIVFGVNGGYRRGRYVGYVGDNARYHGKTALLMFREGQLVAQFDDLSTPLAYDWHPFPLSDFEIDA